MQDAMRGAGLPFTRRERQVCHSQTDRGVGGGGWLAQSIVGNGPFESLMTTTNARSRRAELPRKDLVGGFGAGGRPGPALRISHAGREGALLTFTRQ